MKPNNIPSENAAVELGHSYRDVLRRRIVELRAFSARCLEGKLTPAEIEDIHLRVRSLVGSGATYGHRGVSAAADPLDQALASPSTFGLKALASLAGGLADACDQALHNNPDSMKDNVLQFKTPLPPMQNSRPVLLAVDDDPAIHDLIKAMLRNTVHVISAYNAVEAIDAVRQYSPDIILLDNYMPDATGLRLLEDLSNEKNSAATPVIMLTADRAPREIMRAATIGIADYIVKPFEPQALAEKVISLTQRMQNSVLIAHNNPAIRELIANRLRRMGITSIVAANSQNALALAAARMPDLILLDQSMPGMESGGVLHNLRTDRLTRHIPVLYISADRMGHAKIENLDTGAADELIAPSPPEKVAEHIMDALDLEIR